MTTAPVGLMTFAEYERIPDPPGFRYELHRGELVKMASPIHDHYLIQRELRRKLKAAAGSAGVVDTEMSFRAWAEHECRVADVAFVSQPRWDRIPRKGYLQGAPEIVIEVLSPSNTASEIFDKEQLCLENGSLEFWVVDPVRSQVKISAPDGRANTYKQGQKIPLLFGGTLSVESIFSE